MIVLGPGINFPPVNFADADGFLAVGGDLSSGRILSAYRKGIFPWYNVGEPICWWSPDPRCVLFPANLRVSKTMKKLIREDHFSFTVNNSFGQVIRHCQQVKRRDHTGTWIQEEIIEAYTKLHREGFAHSAEAWLGDTLVGGLYGIRIGKVFFGESMFSLQPNASKFAFIKYVELLMLEAVALIDCQVHTAHLESLGAGLVDRSDFIKMLDAYC